MQNTQHIKHPASGKDAKALGKAFWSIVDLYGLNRAEQALILGINNNGQRLLELEKKQTLPDGTMDVFPRVGILVGIHKNLRILYPHNRDLVYGFLKRPWSLLNKKKPIDFLKEDPQMSYQRLFTIRRMLDNLRVAF